MKTLVCSMWDDGLKTDLQIIRILKKYKTTSCFAISPNRHSFKEKPNDYRSEKYGYLLTKEELKLFKNYEICNHSLNHYDFKYLNQIQTIKEITESHYLLEEIFKKTIKGFCYPYGVSNEFCKEEFKKLNYKYARVTKIQKTKNPLEVSPTHKWNETINFENHVFFWGHSYEISDWDKINQLYEKIANNKNIEVVSVEDWVKNVIS